MKHIFISATQGFLVKNNPFIVTINIIALNQWPNKVVGSSENFG